MVYWTNHKQAIFAIIKNPNRSCCNNTITNFLSYIFHIYYISFDGFSDQWCEWRYDIHNISLHETPESPSDLYLSHQSQTDKTNILNPDFIHCTLTHLSSIYKSKITQITMPSFKGKVIQVKDRIIAQLMKIWRGDWTVHELCILWRSYPVDDHITNGTYYFIKTLLDAITNKHAESQHHYNQDQDADSHQDHDQDQNQDQDKDQDQDPFQGELQVTLTCTDTECKQQHTFIESFNCLNLSVPNTNITSIVVDIHHESIHTYIDPKLNQITATTKPLRTIYHLDGNLTLLHLARQIATDFNANREDIFFGEQQNGRITDIIPRDKNDYMVSTFKHIVVYICRTRDWGPNMLRSVFSSSASSYSSRSSGYGQRMCYNLAISLFYSDRMHDGDTGMRLTKQQPFLLRITGNEEFTCKDLYKYIYVHLALTMLSADVNIRDLFKMPQQDYYQQMVIKRYLAQIRMNIPQELFDVIYLFCDLNLHIVLWICQRALRKEQSGSFDQDWERILSDSQRGFNIKWEDSLSRNTNIHIPCVDKQKPWDIFGVRLLNYSLNHVNIYWTDRYTNILSRDDEFGKIVVTKEYMDEKEKDVLRGVTLNDCIDEYMCNQNMILNCKGCNKLEITKQRMDMIKAPQLIVFHLDLIYSNLYGQREMYCDAPVICPESLDINGVGDDTGTRYKLVGKSEISYEEVQDLPVVLFYSV